MCGRYDQSRSLSLEGLNLLLGDGCQAVGVVRYLLNDPKLVQFVEPICGPALA
jgi:hypothetical protein